MLMLHFAQANTKWYMLRGGEVDDRETEMMAVRWKVFVFFYQIPASKQLEIPSCGSSMLRKIYLQQVPNALTYYIIVCN